MEEIFKSKFKFSLLFVFFFLALILGIPAAAGISGLIDNIQKNEPFNEIGSTIIMPFLMLAFILYMILHYVLITPKIIISKKGVQIGSTHIMLNEIEEILIREKKYIYFLIIPYPQESTILRTQNREWTIPVENYSNGHLIRTNFAQIKDFLIDKKSSIKVYQNTFIETKKRFHQTFDFQEYKRSLFRFFNTYMFGILIGMFLFLGFGIRPNIFLSIFGGTFALLFYFVLGMQTHYFLISNEYIIVKNLLLPFRYFSFNLKDIEVLETEDLPKQETSLKIITADYKIRRFQSGLLTYDMFNQLIRKAKSKAHNIR